MAADVALVNLPFFSTTRPSLSLSLLKAGLNQHSVRSDIHYLNLLFASLIGRDLCEQFDGSPKNMLVLEWIFSEAFSGSNPDLDKEYLQLALDEMTNPPSNRSPESAQALIDELQEYRARVEPFFAQALDQISWDAYKIVGFSSMFQQQMASLGLAFRLKQAFPHLFIVFGGANCEGVMGRTLFRTFPFIDGVCSGEGDFVFPLLVQQVLRQQERSHIPGILQRGLASDAESARAHSSSSKDISAGKLFQIGPARSTDPLGEQENKSDCCETNTTAPMVMNLDELPYADFDDYFEQRRRYGVPHDLEIVLPFETSRGCWWGEHQHCTFCGLNGLSMQFRHKSSGRAFDELSRLVKLYGDQTRHLTAVDNILPMSYFKDLIPFLGELAVEVFYETKSNLREEHVALLKQGNIRFVQPGIESLSTPVLKLMRKGVTALQNLQLLKLCVQYGITPYWNFLIGFPGETVSDYDGVLELIETIPHFPPPYDPTVARVRFDRFSPYFFESEKLGVRKLYPFECYRFIYPRLDEQTRTDLAYYFMGDFDGQDQIEDYEEVLSGAVRSWHDTHHIAALFEVDADEMTIVCDFRPRNKKKNFHFLSGPWRSLYKECRSICSVKKLRSTFPELTASDIEAFVEFLESNRLAWREKDSLLSLSVPLGYAYSPPPDMLKLLLGEIDSVMNRAQLM